MKKYFLVNCVVAFVTAGYVHAADVVEYEPPANYEVTPVSVPDFSWVGGYIGAQIGGTWSETDVDGFYRDTVTPANNGSLFRQAPDPSGFSGGLYLGYNFAFEEASGFIFGLETDFSWGSIDEKSPYVMHDLTPNGYAGLDWVSRSHVKQKWAGATRVRVAYNVDRWLPYIAAGVAYARVESGVDGWIESSGVVVPTSSFNVRNQSTLTGWTAGVGTDYAMTDNVLLRLEYRYSDYGDKTYSYDLTGSGTNFGDYKIDHKTHDLHVGVAYKF